MAQKYAKGSRAWGICGRSGRKMLLRDMVFDGRYPNMRVDPDWFEDQHPQERMPKVEDPTALYRPSPEVIAAPTAPVLTVTAPGGGAAAQLTWTPAETDITEIASYTIMRSVDDGPFTELITCNVLRDFLGGIIGVEHCTTTPSIPRDDSGDSGSVYDKVTFDDAPVTYIDQSISGGHTYCYNVIGNPMGNNQSVAQGPPSAPSNTGCVTVGAGAQFIAVGGSGAGASPVIVARSSSTGLWSQKSSAGLDPAEALLSVARTLGGWLIGSNNFTNSQIAFSFDEFATLTLEPNPFPGQNYVAASGDANIALLGGTRRVMYSGDGATWGQSGLVGPGSYVVAAQGLAVGPGLFVGTGIGSGNSNNILSTDGIVWTPANYTCLGGNAIIFDGTQFVQLSGGALVATSVNGTDFIETPLNLNEGRSLAYNGHLYVVIESASSRLLASPTIAGLATATPQTVAAGIFTAIAVDPITALFVALDTLGYAYSSTDGVTWTQETTPAVGLGLQLNAIAWNSGGTAVPSASPPVLAGSVVGSAVDLTWSASTVSGSTITNYLLYRSVDAGGFSLLIALDGVTLAYNDTTTTAGHTYNYYIVAHPLVGRDSLRSNTVTESAGGGGTTTQFTVTIGTVNCQQGGIGNDPVTHGFVPLTGHTGTDFTQVSGGALVSGDTGNVVYAVGVSNSTGVGFYFAAVGTWVDADITSLSFVGADSVTYTLVPSAGTYASGQAVDGSDGTLAYTYFNWFGGLSPPALALAGGSTITFTLVGNINVS